MSSFFSAHKRVIARAIIFSLVAYGVFWLTPSWSEAGPFYFLLAFALFVMLIAGQVFWVGRVIDLGETFIPGRPRRAWLTALGGLQWRTASAGTYHQARQLDAALLAGRVGAGGGAKYSAMAEPVLPLGDATGTKDRQSRLGQETGDSFFLDDAPGMGL